MGPEGSGGKKDHRSLLFNRQFILVPHVRIDLPDWRAIAFAQFRLHHHPHLSVAGMDADGKQLLCLGYVFDPLNGERDMQAIGQALLEKIGTFSDFEKESARFSGRYVFLLRIGKEVRLYPDAGALRSVFYTRRQGRHGLVVGSQPGLLAQVLGMKKDEEYVRRFYAHGHGDSWPGTRSPFIGIDQLLPNHYLDMTTGESVRFWPKGPGAEMDAAQAASRINDLLEGALVSAGKRYRLFLGLTAGHDSRLLLCAAKKLQHRLQLFLIRSADTPEYDVRIPLLLAQTLQMKCEVIAAAQADDDFLRIYDANVCHIIGGESRTKAQTYECFPEDALIVKGHAAEVGRCYYYPHGRAPEKISAAHLCRVAKYKKNPIAAEAFSEWLADLPAGHRFNVLDLFYWEHRLGNWLAMENTGSDTNFQVYSPFNCRLLLECFLSVGLPYRKKPYLLHQQICRLNFPALAQLPFNPKPFPAVFGRKLRKLKNRLSKKK